MRRALGRTAAVALLCTGACAFVPAAGDASAPGAVGIVARTITLNESASLHRTGHHGVHIDEQGTATGTIRGTIYIHLDASSPTRVGAEVNIYPSNGSLSGSGSASYRASGGQATFSGTLSITRGTGTYAHAHASNLRFSGTIQRINDATTVRLSGPLSY